MKNQARHRVKTKPKWRWRENRYSPPHRRDAGCRRAPAPSASDNRREEEWERSIRQSGIGLGLLLVEHVAFAAGDEGISENPSVGKPVPEVSGIDIPGAFAIDAESDENCIANSGKKAPRSRFNGSGSDSVTLRVSANGNEFLGTEVPEMLPISYPDELLGGGAFQSTEKIRGTSEEIIEENASNAVRNPIFRRPSSTVDRPEDVAFGDVVTTSGIVAPSNTNTAAENDSAPDSSLNGPTHGAQHVAGLGGVSGHFRTSWTVSQGGDRIDVVSATLWDSTRRPTSPRSTQENRVRNMAATAPLVEGVAVRESEDGGGRLGSLPDARSEATVGLKVLLRQHLCVLFGVLLVAVIAIAGIILGLLISRRRRDIIGEATSEHLRTFESLHPTAELPGSPSKSPSRKPTTALVTGRFRDLQDMIIGLNISDVSALLDPISPQYSALSWLADEDNRSISLEDIPAIVQRYVLAALYFSTNGEDWAEQGGFMSSSHECDDWFGVYCYEESGIVYSISMEDNNMLGTLPREIGFLSLSYLILDSNILSGTIPESLRLLGESLITLRLSYNSLTGKIPDFFADLTLLNFFDVGVNRLTGTLPTSLDMSRNMKYFSANSNLLYGKVGINFETLPSLRRLSLWDNLLSGSIPDSVGSFKGTLLYLGENSITGTIPEALAFLPNLELLGLWDMQLNGTIPSGLFAMENLIAVGVGGNDLTGTLPSVDNGARDSLTAIGVERNHLTGRLPSSFGDLGAIKAILAHSNYLTGIIPEAIGNNFRLRALDLGNNKLTGTVPQSFLQLVDLTWLSFTKNELTGNINFLCDLDIQFVSSDCGSDAPQIECTCCATCCGPTINCGVYLDTGPLIKIYCSGTNCWEEQPWTP